MSDPGNLHQLYRPVHPGHSGHHLGLPHDLGLKRRGVPHLFPEVRLDSRAGKDGVEIDLQADISLLAAAVVILLIGIGLDAVHLLPDIVVEDKGDLFLQRRLLSPAEVGIFRERDLQHIVHGGSRCGRGGRSRRCHSRRRCSRIRCSACGLPWAMGAL